MAARAHGASAYQRKKIALENQAQDEQDDDAAQAEMDTSHPKASASAAFIAAVFYVVTASTRCPAHDFL